MADTLCDRDNTLTIRLAPSHAGACENERADQATKRAAEERDEWADPAYLGEASLSYLTRKTTERRSEATIEWVGTRVGQRRRYRPSPGGKIRKGLARVRKELTGRFFQLLSEHAATAERLTRIGQAASPQLVVCDWGATIKVPSLH